MGNRGSLGNIFREGEKMSEKQMRIETTKSRDEIEQELKDKGFKLTYEWHDDQIWTDKTQDNLIWISSINAVAYYYNRTGRQEL